VSSFALFLRTYLSVSINAILDAIDSACRADGIDLHIIRVAERDTGLAYIPLLRPQSTEGAIVLSVTSDLSKTLAAMAYRIVELEPQTDSPPNGSVETCSDAVVAAGLGHLFELGHRNIALLVTEPKDRRSVVEKIRAFEDKITQLGIQGNVVFNKSRSADGSFEIGSLTMAKAWKLEPRPTAVFAVSDPGAMGAMSWCQQHGIGVPDQLSVLGFEGIRSGAMVYPTLTSVGHAVPEIAHCLLEQLKQNQPRRDTIDPILILRNSTKPPRG
jgi:LacI family transcriptional regulator